MTLYYQLHVIQYLAHSNYLKDPVISAIFYHFLCVRNREKSFACINLLFTILCAIFCVQLHYGLPFLAEKWTVV